MILKFIIPGHDSCWHTVFGHVDHFHMASCRTEYTPPPLFLTKWTHWLRTFPVCKGSRVRFYQGLCLVRKCRRDARKRAWTEYLRAFCRAKYRLFCVPVCICSISTGLNRTTWYSSLHHADISMINELKKVMDHLFELMNGHDLFECAVYVVECFVENGIILDKTICSPDYSTVCTTLNEQGQGLERVRCGTAKHTCILPHGAQLSWTCRPLANGVWVLHESCFKLTTKQR